jgi:hypothetical protein
MSFVEETMMFRVFLVFLSAIAVSACSSGEDGSSDDSGPEPRPAVSESQATGKSTPEPVNETKPGDSEIDPTQANDAVMRAIQAVADEDEAAFGEYVIEGKEWLWDKVVGCQGISADTLIYQFDYIDQVGLDGAVTVYYENGGGGGFLLELVGERWLLGDWLGEVNCTQMLADVLPTATPDPTATPEPPFPLRYIPLSYSIEAVGDGWMEGHVDYLIENVSTGTVYDESIPREYRGALTSGYGSRNNMWLELGNATLLTDQEVTYEVDDSGSADVSPTSDEQRILLPRWLPPGLRFRPMSLNRDSVLSWQSAEAAIPVAIEFADKSDHQRIDLPETGYSSSAVYPFDEGAFDINHIASFPDMTLEEQELHIEFNGTCSKGWDGELVEWYAFRATLDNLNKLEENFAVDDIYLEADLFNAASGAFSRMYFHSFVRSDGSETLSSLGPAQSADVVLVFVPSDNRWTSFYLSSGTDPVLMAFEEQFYDLSGCILRNE